MASNSPTWEELMGSNKWEALLEPDLNLSLREFILRCGNFSEATYDAFNTNSLSKNCGNSRYNKESFFRQVMLEKASRYQVVGFLYATSGFGDPDKNFFCHPGDAVDEPWDRHSNWIGYVAVTTDKVSRALGRREVYVVWRGTMTGSEWTSNIFGANPVSAKPLLTPPPTKASPDWFSWLPFILEPKVHSGWLTIYTSANADSKHNKESAREQLHDLIQEIRSTYDGEKLSVVVTGHSLGGAMATLSAFDLTKHKVAGDGALVSAIVFGSPQVGNDLFKDLVDNLSNLKILHVQNIRDMVPKTPDGDFFRFYVPIETADLEIDTNISPYLKSKGSIERLGDWHNLEANLHVVAWWNGPYSKLQIGDEPKVKRSLALVNKSSRYLVDWLRVPEYWWIEKNKGMEYNENTEEWELDDHPLPR